MAKAISWCPRQTPKTGLGWGAPSTLRRPATVCWQSCGSPGPLLMKSPSKSVPRQKQSHRGDTGPCAPCGSQRDRPSPCPAAQRRCSPECTTPPTPKEGCAEVSQTHGPPARSQSRWPSPTPHHVPCRISLRPSPRTTAPMTAGYDDTEAPKLPVTGQDVVPQGPQHQPGRQPLLQIPSSPLQGPGSPWPGPPHLRCPGDGPREPR